MDDSFYASVNPISSLVSQETELCIIFEKSKWKPHFMVCFIFLFQNKEAEKQLKFFRDCVAAAFAERDHSIMEVIIVMISLS